MCKTNPYDRDTVHLSPDAPGIAKAADLLRAGRLVAFPTETVYGLGADATNGEAVAAIYEAKGRPHFNPLIVHVESLGVAETLATVPAGLQPLAKARWPGPLTLVVPLKENSPLSSLVTAGLPTVALRVPANPVARDLLKAANRPIAAPSANPSGRISPTSAEHVARSLTGRIDAIIHGPACTVGLESTIVTQDGEHTRLLRPGGLASEDIEALLGTKLLGATGGITAPGQLAAHYAPAAALRLNAQAPRENELFLAFGGMPTGATGLDLSPTANLREAAAKLFGHLHRLDDMAAETGKTIAAAPVPATGLGRAINDRLARAATR